MVDFLHDLFSANLFQTVHGLIFTNMTLSFTHFISFHVLTNMRVSNYLSKLQMSWINTMNFLTRSSKGRKNNDSQPFVTS